MSHVIMGNQTRINSCSKLRQAELELISVINDIKLVKVRVHDLLHQTEIVASDQHFHLVKFAPEFNCVKKAG